MTQETRRKKIRWLRHVISLFAVGISLVLLAIVIFLGSGMGDAFLRRVLIRRIDTLTGGKTEIAKVSIAWLSLHTTLSGVVVHGLEPKDTEPLFRADTIQLGLHIDSFWGRKVSLDELIVLAPRFHIRVSSNGANNLPLLTMKPSARPLPESLFDLHVRKLRIENGWVLYNDTESPLSVEGGDLHFSLDAASGPSPLYLGNLDWKSIHFTANRFLPLPANLSAKFTVGLAGFTLEQGVLSMARSHLDAQGAMLGFVNPKWTFRYRGWVDLVDIRQALRTPEVPYGRVDVRGEGTFANGMWHSAGNYVAQNITLDLQDFHAGNLFNRTNFVLDNQGIDLQNFVIQGLGGNVTGHVHMSFAGLFFRATTHVQNVRLSSVLPAIDHQGFPVDQLH